MVTGYHIINNCRCDQDLTFCGERSDNDTFNHLFHRRLRNNTCDIPQADAISVTDIGNDVHQIGISSLVPTSIFVHHCLKCLHYYWFAINSIVEFQYLNRSLFTNMYLKELDYITLTLMIIICMLKATKIKVFCINQTEVRDPMSTLIYEVITNKGSLANIRLR